MSISCPFPIDDPAKSTAARVTAVQARAFARLEHAIDDLFLRDDARLSDRTRAAVHATLAGIVANAEAEMRRHAARLLAGRGATQAAMGLLRGEPVLRRLKRAGLLRDPELMEELLARVELALLADTPPAATGGPDRPSLLARLAGCPDRIVASAATTFLAAEARARAALDGSGPIRSELRADLYRRLVWYIAAGLREQPAESESVADRDRALAEATTWSLAAYDEADRQEALAERLASAIDAREDELAALLVEAISDRRMTLFVAVAARAAGMNFDQVRGLTVDPQSDLLLLLLHAVGVDRVSIARIGVALAEADPRRDLEHIADAVDWAVAHERAAARAALAPLELGRDFRAAVRALERSA